MQTVTIKDNVYVIRKECKVENFWSQGDFKRKVRFFDAIGSCGNGHFCLANYGKYWGVGDHYYDSTENLYSQMFIANQNKFMQIIDSDPEQQAVIQKTQHYSQILPLLFPLLKSIKYAKDSRYVPQPTDTITNPLALIKSSCAGVRLPTMAQQIQNKREKFNAALDAGAVAYKRNGETIPLGAPGADFNNVELFYDRWCIQEELKQQTIRSRDNLEFVIYEQLPRQEHTKFEFYRAGLVNNDWYGKIVQKDSCICAKIDTIKGTFWAYGETIARARAFLTAKLYDVFQNVIEQVGNISNIPQK
ncbi:MAG: hypothetical protein IKN73_00110 [Alphaproteobacteria bacterium]|nr:hypothetical protein [Alphaproteobacteria bacterium]